MSIINIAPNSLETKITKIEKDKFGGILITVETTEDHVVCRICGKKTKILLSEAVFGHIRICIKVVVWAPRRFRESRSF
jgi:hypothetical protein